MDTSRTQQTPYWWCSGSGVIVEEDVRLHQIAGEHSFLVCVSLYAETVFFINLL